MKKAMLMNVLQPEESRIAILEGNRLEELYVERNSVEAYAGNIYRGKIVNLEPSIQAAFVDFGVGRNGFLHISDVEPQYFRQGGYDPVEIMRESDEMAEAAAKRARESGRGNKRAYKGGRP
jgi:ribonuclease E